jgi:hypothetical protein
MSADPRVKKTGGAPSWGFGNPDPVLILWLAYDCFGSAR